MGKNKDRTITRLKAHTPNSAQPPLKKRRLFAKRYVPLASGSATYEQYHWFSNT
jgi:hypothetical protein